MTLPAIGAREHLRHRDAPGPNQADHEQVLLGEVIPGQSGPAQRVAHEQVPAGHPEASLASKSSPSQVRRIRCRMWLLAPEKRARMVASGVSGPLLERRV